MKIVAVRSIPLSAQTKAAWKAAGVTFASRRLNMEQAMSLPWDIIINLGDGNFNPIYPEKVVNLGSTIKELITPGGTRRLFGDLIPPEPTNYPCDAWLKGPGRAGHNKLKVRLYDATSPQQQRRWDTQVHVDGQEYRLITVGRRIVQQHRRRKVASALDSVRTYIWEPKQDTPTSVRKLARKAAGRLDTRTIIGWDIILPMDGKTPYLLEGNSCPGLNDATARRIVTELERGHNAQ